MKVLYIGHYRDGTGWGNAAINNILAMDAAGIDVVPRAITYESDDRPYPDRIKELESKPKDGCDVVVQHTLPCNYWYDGSYKNIGCLACETSDFKSTGWQHNCNLMDEIWVPSLITKQQTLASDVKKPIKIIPYSLDLSDYENAETKHGQKIDNLQNNFTFGFVGEFIERKNLKALIQAFHMTFEPQEPVNLFIKTSKTELTQLQKYCRRISDGLKLRKKYKEEVIVVGRMEKEDYISVLSQVDCFVMPSRGEAFCIPSLEAMALGIPSIYTMYIGMEHVVGQPVRSNSVPCFGAMETLPNLDTADADWQEIEIRGLSETMRYMYSHLSEQENKDKWKNSCLDKTQEYSHAAVGKLIKEILNDG